jgi:hypothetical protein
MYIRIKRDKTTYFIRCKPSDKILDIKEKLQELIDQPVNDQRLILPGTGEVLEDTKTLADQKVHYYISLHVIYYVNILFKNVSV